MRQRLAALILTGLLALLALPAATTAAECEFILGFATLKALIDAAEGPDKVGDCLENQRFNPENGDALQQTTGGLLVWRKADNWTAFTDGYRTWINGPHGLQARLNTEQFDWEGPATPPALTVEQLKNAEYGEHGKLTGGTLHGVSAGGPSGSGASLIQTTLRLSEHVAFGDLNGDTIDDTAVILTYNPARHGYFFFTLAAVVNEQGQPQYVASASLGDRVKIESLTVQDSRIVVRLFTHGPNDQRSVPTQEVIRTFRLEGDALALVAEENIANIAQCSNGIAVPNPQANLGLVADCAALLQGRDTLAGSTTLNWSVDRVIPDWDGITVSGSPPRVIALDLSKRTLNGAIPSQLGALANLQWLILSGNRLSGPIPPELGRLTSLRKLELNRNQLSGPVPRQLGSLANLERLDISGNQLSGPISPQLGMLTNLEGLKISTNQLSGPIPPELGRLANLRELVLHQNQLIGPLPPELGGLTNLQRLWLFNNQLTGPIPPELGGLTNLWTLGLHNNQLTGPIPPELGTLTNLQVLSLRNNQLTGPIPPQLGALTNLEELSLSRNQLTGPIPPQLGALTTLRALWLDGNRLTGPIPPQLGALTNLEGLDLFGNQLTGPIPPQLGALTNLRALSLFKNQLTGPIPPELGNLTNLRSLGLSDNGLIGPIPPELGTLTNLRVLSLRNTALTGCIPPALRGVILHDFDKLGLTFCRA